MEKNYTPLDIQKFNNTNESKINFILFLVLVMTAVVLGILLYILMQKNTNSNKNQPTISPTVKPTIMPTSVKMITPTIFKASPSATIMQRTDTPPVSTTSPQIITVFPNSANQRVATQSSANP